MGHAGELEHGLRLNQKIYATSRPGATGRSRASIPYVFLDGIVLKRSWAGEVRNVSVLVAIGVDAEVTGRSSASAEGAKEDKSGWRGFLRHLKDRGLSGVRAHHFRCLPRSRREPRPSSSDARWQRCVVHFYRNVFSHVPASKVARGRHMLKAIHAQEDRGAAEAKAAAVVDELRAMKLGRAAELVEQQVAETLTYYAFPDATGIKIRTNNPLERIIREIRRRTRVVGAFPDGNSALMLVAARLRHIASTKWGKRRYLVMEKLLNPAKHDQEAAA